MVDNREIAFGLVTPPYARKLVSANGETIDGAIANPMLAEIAQPARNKRTASSRPNK